MPREQNMKITVETKVNAPVEAVWKAYTSPADIIQWNAASPDWRALNAMRTLNRARPKGRGLRRN
jgi:uncharacterized protein YndB with AHSA1/START domain